jgi:hypothetical protein
VGQSVYGEEKNLVARPQPEQRVGQGQR